MPEGVKIFQGDNNMDKINISVDRFYGEHDLTEFNAYLKIKYVNDSCNQIYLNKLEETEDKLILQANIDNNLTRYAGELTCQPFFANDNNSQCFNASTFALEVEPSIEAYETIEQEVLPSTIITLQSELKSAQEKYEQSVAGFDLGEVAYQDLATAFDNVLSSGIYKFFAISESGAKEPGVLISNRITEEEGVQTMFYLDEDGAFTKIYTRRGYFNTFNIWEIWHGQKIATEEYVNQKIEELKASI